MPTFTPEFLVRATGGRWTTPPTEKLVGFTQDTRRLTPGQVFVALRTPQRDGHDFLAEARKAGASAAIVARVDDDCALPQLVVPDPLQAFQAIARDHRRTFRGPVIAITGSAGKTSTKNLLAALLGSETRVLATEGNLNNLLGVPLTLTRIDPDQHAYAVIEAGISEPGEMAVLAAMIEPDVALVTLVAPAHLEALGSVDGVAREKSLLARAARLAILPKPLLAFAAFRSLDVRTLLVEPAEVIRPDVPAPESAYFAVSHRENITALSLAYGPPPPRMFTLPRVSDGMAQNAVLAVCTALRLGLPIDTIRARLAAWRPAAMRGELRRDGERLVYLDCYNANPASMADALANFYRITPVESPRLFVLGGMEELGPDAARYHRALGRQLQLRPEDACCVIGDEAESVKLGALESGMRADQFLVTTTLEPIARRVSAFRGSVFIKGSRKHALERALGLAPH
jgi:UDP-N-acetylmuramoyl-tripeptide--D-alanyl-D-alanine ligase